MGFSSRLNLHSGQEDLDLLLILEGRLGVSQRERKQHVENTLADQLLCVEGGLA